MPDEERIERDTRLRADIRLLGNLLGETLVRQEGAGLLELVEDVRALTKRIRGGTDDDRDAADELTQLLAQLDLETTIQLVRAFSAFFYLANVAEQTHRLDEEGARSGQRGWLAATVDRVLAADMPAEILSAVATRLELRPVFTAHPTEAARRSILTKTDRVADLLELRADPRLTDSDRDRIDRRLAEVVDLIWQTDELRRERPTPIDEARSVMYYFDEIFREVAAELFDELDHQLGRLGIELPSTSRPLHFGTWVGGDRDGNPNVTPDVTMRVLQMQHDHALRELIAAVEQLATDLSSSDRITPITDELEMSLAGDARDLPSTYEVFSDLSAGEAYRQKCAYVHQRLINTRQRLADETPHHPGRDYGSADALLDDLAVMRRSLLAHHGELIARGSLDRLIRRVATFGFRLATMDVREHATAHHAAISQLYARLDVAYPADPAERTAVLAAELESRRPLASLTTRLDDGPARTVETFHTDPQSPRPLRPRHHRELHRVRDPRPRGHPLPRRPRQGCGPDRPPHRCGAHRLRSTLRDDRRSA